MKTPATSSERGVALLTALLATALLTVIVMQFTFRTQVEARRTAQWINAKRAGLLAESGLLFASELLSLDGFGAYATAPDLRKIDHLGELWAASEIPIPVEEDVSLTFRIQDDSGLYDLNRLRSRRLEERERAERLFRSVEVDTALIGSIIDWIDDDSTTFPVPEGAENSYYLGLPQPHAARNGYLRTFAELALIRGVEPSDLVRLRTVASVTPSKTKSINVNTAPPEVLSAMIQQLRDPVVLNRFLARRDTAPFKKLEEVGEIEGLEGVELDKIADVKSEYFRVRSTAGAGGAYRSVEALLHREGGRIQLLYWTRRRGPNLPASDDSARNSLDELNALLPGGGLRRR